ncbi:hypothetical protein DL89DRAFT_267811 [Linderina pennispora]|uniref:Uncharacterized protein n=1 Tax=Linderina pennispora TaxID=61395 RepID=A0A1Y1W8Z5_9FUNG|nr:uncharacterized protein DL89DRAFT_267811 [Linderina pennispora]ORX69634.1 hypothetical protein DL89DRAFT_267811 [Linderina pennispora]
MPVQLPSLDLSPRMICVSPRCDGTRKADPQTPVKLETGLATPPESPIATRIPSSLVRTASLPGGVHASKGASRARGGRTGVPAPVPWERFKQLVDAKNLEPLGRSYECQARYEKHMARMRCEYGSVANFLIKHALADFIATTMAPGFAKSAPIDTSDFLFRVNDFPYYLADGVEHWVMWCRKRLTPGFDAPEAAVQAIQLRFGQDVEWRYFVNPVAKQSVPQLSHAHVFVKTL